MPYIVFDWINGCYIWYRNEIEISRKKRGEKYDESMLCVYNDMVRLFNICSIMVCD